MKNLAALLFLFCIAQLSFSQDYEITHYTVEDGLMSNDVKGVFQDSLGVIWVANGLGFTKFYGDKVENIETPGSPGSVDEMIILKNSYVFGNILIGQDGSKLIKHSRNTFTSEKYEGYSRTMTTTPYSDKQGYYWAYSEDSTFFRATEKDTIDLLPWLDANNLNFQIETRGYSNNIIIDNHKNIWIRTTNHQIHRFDFNNNEFVTSEFHIPFLTDIAFLSEENFVAVGTAKDSVQLRVFYTSGSGLKYINIESRSRSIVIYKNHAYLFQCDGLYKLDNGVLLKMKSFESEDCLSTIIEPKLDHNGVLMFLEQNQQKHQLIAFDGISFDTIISLNHKVDHFFIDESDAIWISAMDKGLILLQKTNNKKVAYTPIRLTDSVRLLPHLFKTLQSGIEIFTIRINNETPWIEENLNLYVKKDKKFVLLYEGVVGNHFLNPAGNTFFFDGEQHVFRETDRQKEIYDYLQQDHQPHIYSIDSFFRLKDITPKELREIKDPYYVRHLAYLNNSLYIIVRKSMFLKKLDGYEQIAFPKSNNLYFRFPKSQNDSIQIIIYENMGPERIDSIVMYNANTKKFKPFPFKVNEGIRLESNESYYNENGSIITRLSNPLLINDSSVTNIFELNGIKNSYFTEYFIFENNMYGNMNEGIAKIDLESGKIQLIEYGFDAAMKLSPDSHSFWIYNNAYARNLPFTAFEGDSLVIEEWNQSEGYHNGKMVFHGDSILRMYFDYGYVERKLKNRYIHPAPFLHFTQLRLNYEAFDWSQTTTKVDSFSGNVMPHNMQLAHDQNHLTFDFQGVSHSNKKPLQYYHQLVGQDEQFYHSANKSVTYSNLEPGEYTFNVYVQDENESKSETLTCSFTVKPPFWQTWWFISLCIIAIGSTAYSGYQYNIKRLKARQEELEQEVEVATVAIREQKNEIEKQKVEVEKQKDEIEESHREITDSINYAERIQRSFLATTELLNENLNEYFVYFNPKEAVSGDFYWAGKLNNGNFALVNADSTGHGVPGAIMSILNISSIEKAVDQNLTKPADIFNQTRTTIIERLKNDGSQEGGKDGMDASLIAFDNNKTKMYYVAAQNPIWIIRDGALTEIKPEKMPVGKHHNDHVEFVGGEYDLQKGDVIYTLTDGFQDQFGGVKGKKFMVKKMREYVLSISNLSMAEQHQKIKDTFTNWKGGLEQIDDVCVIGVRV